MEAQTRTYRIPRVRCSLVRDGSMVRDVRTIGGSADVFRIVREELEACDREVFAVLLLDGKHKVNGFDVVSVGTVNASLVSPREVYKSAILANAVAIIAVHNHPSGDPTPSPEDVAITARLRAAGETLGIRLLDHVVVGDGRFYSFLDHRGL